MCGIAGLIAPGVGQALAGTVAEMSNALVHRGPDDHGAWIDPHTGVGLGHRRLSIIDLSPNGRQPMQSHCGRFVITFNGEIYNHLDLRRALEQENRAPNWRGHSDTETLIAAISAWGVLSAFRRSVGMFAAAVWDASERRLFLVRDRLGEKPLYYGWVGCGFVFTSELKALRELLTGANEIDRRALDLYFRFSYVPAPHSIYRRIYKLEPGCMLSASLQSLAEPLNEGPSAPFSRGSLRIERYWSLEELTTGRHSTGNEQENLEEFEHRLAESVRLQSVADVPLGAFLSGGIDSSTIVALMQAQSSRRVKTYTIGFEDSAYDEAGYARAVACQLGTDHTELTLTEAEAREVIPKLPQIYCEPFADSSQIPTYLVARMASQSVKVAMSGDGGDELLAGYSRYLWVGRLWARIGRMPPKARSAVLCMLATMPASLWRVTGDKLGVSRLDEKVQKVIERLDGCTNAEELYRKIITEWPTGSLVLGANNVPEAFDDAAWVRRLESLEARMVAYDTLTYLPDDILHKVDRAAMAVSLETRVPFLDHRVVEYAWQLPSNMKIRNGQGKWALRQVLYKHVPRFIVDRPKSGFALPIGQWLRGPLREWASMLLEPAELEEQGYLDCRAITRKWNEHSQGKRDWTASLWSVLMFQEWLSEGAPG